MDDATAALVPPWLEPMLRASYFETCRPHADAARSECNMFCIDCPSAAAFCFYCRSSAHSGHRTVQIRRSSYHDVVRVSEVQTLLDTGGVQTYVINSARVLFLNRRPQPRGGGSSAGGKPSSSGVHLCEMCRRTLLDPFRFCSLGCKLEAIKRKGDACFVPEEGGAGDGSRNPPAGQGTGDDAGNDAGDGRRRRRRGKAKIPTSVEEDAPVAPASGHRRRKGVPHRSPLGGC